MKLDEDKETAAVSLEAQSVLRTLSENNGKGPSVWHPEYGRFMLESTPAGPYGSRLKDLVGVEESMRARRILGESQLPQGHALFTLTAFPRLGCPDSVFPYGLLPSPENEKAASRSLFLPDDVINAHARFPTLTANIRKRRGSKVAINVPIFKDSKTPRPFREPLPPSLSADAYKESKKSLPDVEQDALEDHIYMDCMGFGMGCCCLQVTFQACSVEEARRLYDQLAVMAPIMVYFV